MKDNEYQCANCGGVFEKGRSDKEAFEDFDRDFPGQSHKGARIVCDDCYKAMILLEPPPGRRRSENDEPTGSRVPKKA